MRTPGLPALLLHGMLGSSRLWDEHLSLLGQERRVLAPDLRGHGESRPVEGPLTLDDLVGDALALLDQEGIERAILVGHSLGGMIALLLALSAPSRVAALVLAGTRATAEPLEARLHHRRTLETLSRLGPLPLLRGVARQSFSAETRAARPELVERWITESAGLHMASLPHLARAAMERPDLLSRLGEIRCPTLVIAGEADATTPLAEALALVAGIPGARLIRVPAAGHLVPLEQPAAFGDALRSFLFEIDPLPSLEHAP